jgi:hypothetical protein
MIAPMRGYAPMAYPLPTPAFSLLGKISKAFLGADAVPDLTTLVAATDNSTAATAGQVAPDGSSYAVIQQAVDQGLIFPSDAANIEAGTDTLDNAIATNAAAINALSPAVNAPASGASPAPQVPSGSTLLYKATWGIGLGSLTVSIGSVIQAFQSGLPAHGMQVQSYTSSGLAVLGNQSIQITVLDTIGHALLSDAQSILDSILQSATGGNGLPSPVQIVMTPKYAVGNGECGACCEHGDIMD